MCYDVSSGLKALIKYAKHRCDDVEEIAVLEKQLEIWQHQIKAHHVISGFAHPKLLVFTNDAPLTPQAFTWGLIPFWVKDAATAKSLANQTLNARAESIFEKASFKNSARNKRCLIYIDSFYEHHHFNGKAYPFHIAMKDQSPMALAGLWDQWVDKTSAEVITTVSIVTCPANSIMHAIHNNPKLEAPRMPVILPKERQEDWLRTCKSPEDEAFLMSLCAPLNSALLDFYTVRSIKGKAAVGDTALAAEPYLYEALAALLPTA
jgi:putative SOS response-associated peptidase YedK